MTEPKTPSPVVNDQFGWKLFAAMAITGSLWFRVTRLGNIPGLNADEAFYGVNALSLLHGQAVAWTTPNHNVANPFYFLPILAIHALFAPSVVLLRSIAVVCGILTLVANYHLCRRAFGTTTALASTTLLAVLPENIVTSRSGWDPCQSVLADAFIVYASLLAVKEPEKARKWLGVAAVATAVAIVVHPPNGFTGVFSAVAALIVWREPIAAFLSSAKGRVQFAAMVIAILAGALIGAKIEAPKIAMAMAIRNAPSPGFLIGYERLFSGLTGIQSVSGVPPPSLSFGSWDIAGCLPWVAGTVVLLWMCARRAKIAQVDQLVVIGWLVQAIGFAVVLGGGGLTVGCDRYGLCLILPGALLLTRVAAFVTRGRQQLRVVADLVARGITIGLLAFFQVDYLDHMRHTGGSGYNQYRTAAVEPKLAAWNFTKAHLEPGVNYIVTDRWWLNLPLRYFSASDKQVVVIDGGNIPMALLSDYRTAALEGRTVWVNYAGVNDSNIAVLNDHRVPYLRAVFNDAGNRPLIEVIQPHSPP